MFGAYALRDPTAVRHDGSGWDVLLSRPRGEPGTFVTRDLHTDTFPATPDLCRTGIASAGSWLLSSSMFSTPAQSGS
jgi:hypothetical protein